MRFATNRTSENNVMKDNFVYRYGDNLYVNLTNRCCNDCTFCIRNNGDGIGDSGCLWLDREPTAEECIDRIKAAGDYSELVFCGYGEPTYRVDEMVKSPISRTPAARLRALTPTVSATSLTAMISSRDLRALSTLFPYRSTRTTPTTTTRFAAVSTARTRSAQCSILPANA